MGKTTSSTPVHSTGITERWNKPDNGCVKVNYDATIFKSSGQFGVGWIVRNDTRELIYAANSCFPGKPEVYHAEAIGIREALSWIKAEIDKNEESTVCNSQHRVVVESDCQVAVNTWLKKKKIYSPFSGVIDECRSILESYNNIDIFFVKRSGNKAADWLSNLSSSSAGGIWRGEYVPPDLACILKNDLK
ncbi:uncharacterized protein LOC141685061 [Apium graveolens]|uniref:uncharacterized protein LOC141685061 n=1 Tax=Apium graveolens TaxID=4045 RepID=UPI003D7A6FD4